MDQPLLRQSNENHMNSTLTQKLVQRFEFLLKDHGFHVEQQRDEGVLGQAFVILSSPDFRLRAGADRGQVWADIASVDAPSDWFDLNILRILILGGDLLDQQDVGRLATFLRSEYSTVRDLFHGSKNRDTAQQLRTLQKQRVKRMFPQLDIGLE
jgi:hypothetical protein